MQKGWNIKMNKYESVTIINPNIKEDEMKELIENLKKVITDNKGIITNVENLGKKKLAYEIKKNKEGYYIVLKFEANPEVVTELERLYRIKDEIIKFITIKEEE